MIHEIAIRSESNKVKKKLFIIVQFAAHGFFWFWWSLEIRYTDSPNGALVFFLSEPMHERVEI